MKYLLNFGTPWFFASKHLLRIAIVPCTPDSRYITHVKYVYWPICEFSATINTIEGLLVNFSSREKVKPRFQMTLTYSQNLQVPVICKVFRKHDPDEFALAGILEWKIETKNDYYNRICRRPIWWCWRKVIFRSPILLISKGWLTHWITV